MLWDLKKVLKSFENCFRILNDFNAIIMVDIVDIIEIIDISKMLIDNLGIPVSRLSTRIRGYLCKKMDMRSKRC